MFEILWYLQTTSPDKASRFLQHLRSVRCGDYGSMLGYVAQARSGLSSGLRPPSEYTPANIGGRAHVDLSIPEVMRYQQSPFLTGQDVAGSPIIPSPPPGQDATIHGIKAAVDMFFMCIGGLFYVSDKSDVDKTIERFTASTDGMTLADLVSNARSLEEKTLAAELAGMATMGILHLRLRVPERASSAQLADYLYVVANMV